MDASSEMEMYIHPYHNICIASMGSKYAVLPSNVCNGILLMEHSKISVSSVTVITASVSMYDYDHWTTAV